MKAISIVLLAGLALASLPPAQAQTELVFTSLGTDAAGDDTEAVGSLENPTGTTGSNVIPAPGADQADIDDVLGLAVAATSTDVVFRVEVAQAPEDADRLLGTFCWVAAFQVGSSADEYLALGCTEYDAQGAGTDRLDAQSTRGPNVLTSMAWATDGPAMLLTVERADIGAGPGAVLTDIYALTYMGSSLSVDDPAPDAKADRDAPESFGSYALDTGETAPPGTVPTPMRHVYQEATGSTFEATLEFLPDEWVLYHYNWTSPHNEVRFLCQVSDGAPLWNWLTQVPDAPDVGPGMSSISQESDCVDNAPSGRSVGFKGPLLITISLRAGNGTFSAQIVPAPSTGTPSSTSGAPPSGQPTGTNPSPSPTGTGSEKSPVLPLGLLLVTLVAAAAVSHGRKPGGRAR